LMKLKPNEEDFLERINFFQLQNMAASTSINSVIDQATGEFKRPAAQFRNFISSQSDSKFPPEKGRYHLYVSYACPWGKFHPLGNLKHMAQD
jgi:glutathionyl-hydroquinone reductase